MLNTVQPYVYSTFAGVVSLSALLSSPPLFGWGEYAYIPIQSFCFCDWANHMWYAFFMIGCCFGGPFGVMTVCNIFIYRRVRASGRAVSKGVHEPSPVVYSTCNEKDRTKDNRDSSDDFESPENDVQLENSSDTVARHIDEDIDKDSNDELKHSRCCAFIQKAKTRNDSTNYEVDSGADIKPGDLSNPPCSHDNNANRIPNNTSSIKALRKSKRRRREENRFTITLIVVIIVFVICWFPYCISMLLSIFCKDQVPRAFHMFTLIFGYANSCFNPIIYGLMNKRFAKGFKNLYSCFKKPTIRMPVQSSSWLQWNTLTLSLPNATVVEFTVHCQTRLQSKFTGTVDSCLFLPL